MRLLAQRRGPGIVLESSQRNTPWRDQQVVGDVAADTVVQSNCWRNVMPKEEPVKDAGMSSWSSSERSWRENRSKSDEAREHGAMAKGARQVTWKCPS